ncbi:hypothetical protein [Alienimonas californiensis]|uniref:Polysaccharide pyruvyl transferase n=1 Tax=Alienimonas californiensis TaxID=2527989 RepID=A0A517P4E1_9PLAN|nr:hypothetical protein [Alienimonas californiensis]QDT14239.1 hypothetical protein CA12_03080 [Alienimonas californiensis]
MPAAPDSPVPLPRRIPDYAALVRSFTHLPFTTQRSVNIGDAIQSVAARRLWGVEATVERNAPRTWTDEMHVPLFGWYGGFLAPSPARVTLIGLHLSSFARQAIRDRPLLRDWLRDVQRTQGFPALCRDTGTRDFLRERQIEAEFAGCVSQTLPRATGPRSGVLNFDSAYDPAGGAPLHQNWACKFDPTVAWLTAEAERRLALIAAAAHVHTSRLHVYLPCCALGTPVTLHKPQKTWEPIRFQGLAIDVEDPAYTLARSDSFCRPGQPPAATAATAAI